MLEDCPEILTKPIWQIVNISSGSKFPEVCKTAKVKQGVLIMSNRRFTVNLHSVVA